ncbi:TatD family hydrolase [Desulfobacula sp.]|uniref:TatD family hydrolase n=1 Tax=Desulfobacula sp. TaxID=2593537 RepID=UPI002607904A|nr:TatD family hydrolase [Desulfobacula sp.]
MQFIDSHCHLHDSRILSGIPGILDRANKANVRYMVSCATKETNFELTATLSRQYPSILPCFGVHPWCVDSLSEHWKEQLEHYLLTYPSGIGETGLDFTDKTADRDLQIKVFEHHLVLARELERPINIHIRNAWDTFIHVLKKYGTFKVPGIIHSYSGSADMVPIFEKKGLYVSFSGSVTNPGAKRVINALKRVSKDRFVLETDAPDIYPCLAVPTVSRLNEPGNLPAIARIAASRIGREYEAFSRHAYENSLTLFHPLVQGKKDG